MKKRRIFRNLNDKEFAWVLYDVGNSAYTMLACALIPIWFKAMAIGQSRALTSDRATAYYSMACGDHDRGCVAGSGVWSDF